jgi:uncharacterized protein (DUF1697 family)
MAALVAFLRGVNVGGHRTLRPSRLAQQLRHLDAVNVGATGILVIGKSISQTRLRAEIAERLPFEARIVICRGSEIVKLVSRDFFAGYPVRSDVVRFVSVLPRPSQAGPRLPLALPPEGRWMVRLLARRGRFVVGVYRRQMKVIGYLGSLDRVFGAPVTTRGWNTMLAIAGVLTVPAATGAHRKPRQEFRG